MICPHPSATSTSVRSFGLVSLSAASSPPTSASYVVSVRHLVGLGEKMSGGQNPAYSYIFAGFLPTGCYFTAVALASYTLHCPLHFGIMTFNKETETMYRGLTPHKYTPMPGVLHTEPDLRVVLKWKIYRPNSVIAAVMSLCTNNTLATRSTFSNAFGLTCFLRSHQCSPIRDSSPTICGRDLRTSPVQKFTMDRMR